MRGGESREFRIGCRQEHQIGRVLREVHGIAAVINSPGLTCEDMHLARLQ